MKTLQWRSLFAVTLATVLTAGTFQYVNGANKPSSQNLPLPADSPGLARANELSDAFRVVSKQALPALVSIRTRGKIVHRPVRQQGNSFNEELFQQFGNDPRLRRFLEQQQGGRRKTHRKSGGQGSGFIIDPDGIVMTNSHVVADAEEIIVRLSDGREFKAVDMKHDERSDVAVLKLDTEEQLPFLPLGNDDQMEIGDWVLAFGSPFGLHRSVTQGIISAKGRGLGNQLTQEFLQTDAAVNPGNSGGPLVNLRGEVIGINTAISSRSGGYDGVSLAVPVNLAKWVSDQLLSEGTVQRAYIGIMMQRINASLADAFDLKIPKGVVVTSVVAESPAAAAGFEEGDVVLQVDGHTITTDRNMLGVVEKLDIGQHYVVRVLRNGSERDLDVVAAKRPQKFVKSEESLNESDSDSEANEFAQIDGIDISVQNLTAEIAAELNVAPGSGVVITDVQRNGSAAQAGLRPGMVVTRVGNQSIKGTTEFRSAMKNAGESGYVLLLVKNLLGKSNAPGFIRVPMVGVN